MPEVGVVGIVANPASARDIRRLVAEGSLVTTNDKINLIKRALAGLGSVGVSRVLSMRDRDGISGALADLRTRPTSKGWPTLDFVEQSTTRTAADTTAAVEAMVAAGAGAIIVLGGDGTNGVVAASCGDVPIASISTGTNNAFPRPGEPTVVGIAAGLVATGALDADAVAPRTKALTVHSGAHRLGALVDVAITSHDAVAARAIWEPSSVRELFLTFAEPHRIGLSAIGAHVRPVRRQDPFGLHLRLGEPAATRARVPLGPGLVADVDIVAAVELPVGQTVTVTESSGVVAVDGERALRFGRGDVVTVTLTNDGPRALDVETAMAAAASHHLLTRSTRSLRSVGSTMTGGH